MPVVLLHNIIEVFALPNLNAGIAPLVVHPDGMGITATLVNVNYLWNTIAFNSFNKE